MGFEEISSNADVITLIKHDKKITFKEVDENDTELLFDLLVQRVHSISHYKIPTKNEHNIFVKSNPYRKWMMILKEGRPIGTFYIQQDNSIGINLLLDKKMILEVLRYIHKNFKPLPEVKSKVPPYLYVNIPFSNKKLAQILDNLDAIPIQISYKI